MTEEQLRQRFSGNLARLRKAAGMTQAELAEQLNYSDKSVSKWERGDGLPEFSVAVAIAELFGVTVDSLLSDHAPKPRVSNRYNRLITTLLSLGLPWLAATVLFFFCHYISGFPEWCFFLCAIPVTAIVAIVFTELWWPRWTVFLSTSVLIWSLATTVAVLVHIEGIFLLYIIAAALQVLTVLWFLRKKPF